MQENIYYVYTLSYPTGVVFYVGKGTGDRIDYHEKEAKEGIRSQKCKIIRQIWKNGGQVEKEKVYETLVERDALIYEWVLINIVYGLDRLANSSPGGGHITPIKRLSQLVRQTEHQTSNTAMGRKDITPNTKEIKKDGIIDNNEEYYTTHDALAYLDIKSHITFLKLVKSFDIKKYKRAVAQEIYYQKSDIDKIKRFINELRPLDGDKKEC